MQQSNGLTDVAMAKPVSKNEAEFWHERHVSKNIKNILGKRKTLDNNGVKNE